MNIPIIYEDADVVVVDKPSGVMTHADGRNEGETLADWHAQRVPEARTVGEPIKPPSGGIISRPGIVHRLDRETSGVLILAKTAHAHAHLKAQFKERHAEKTYRAFVFDQLMRDEGVIDRPIGRSARDFRLRSAQRGARGPLRAAVTAFRCIGRSERYSYLELIPKTGRTHQLRVHLKAINHPIVHDTRYAPKRVAADPDALGFARLALHAHTLSLELPSGAHRTFAAPLPDDFRIAGAQLGIAA